MVSRFRLLLLLPVVAGIALAVAALFPSNVVGYLTRLAYFQLEQLWDRTDIEEAIDEGHFTDKQVEKLRLVHPIKDFGRSIGLSATENYETVTPNWNRVIWNISACDPVSFKSRKWWFPIVGTISYIGTFREGDARGHEARLKAQGYDVYVRTAGAYSTLGWFRDPILPKMLDNSEYYLANTMLHELTHATLWIRGSVQFNESFANFVGDEAARRYMVQKYGEESEEVTDLRHRLADHQRYRVMMHGVYKELDTIYTTPGLSDGEKLLRKQATIASLPARAATAGFARPEKYIGLFRRGVWNNARFVQFRTYNRNKEHFIALLEQENGDLHRFISRINEVTDGADDPYKALAEAGQREGNTKPQE
ncbi:MAG: hypothetical protein HN348_24465 [Proteobacteria bacterium]|jgi:predicted aminopeptidase|nr:hypothetical protein [Pseudomonadota bacterium]